MHWLERSASWRPYVRRIRLPCINSRTTMTATRDKLARVFSENVNREEAVRPAVKNKTAITDEHNRRRGLRETTRERAVVAADAAGCPLLPKREWKPLVKGSSASAGAPEALPPYTVVPAPIAPATASAPPVSTAAPSAAAAAASSAVVSATAAACSAETAAAAVAPVPASAPASSPEMETPRAQQLRQDLQMYKLVREAHPELSHEQA